MPKLSDAACRAAKAPVGKQIKLFDESGLFLLVRAKTDGAMSKLWRLRFTQIEGDKRVEKVIALGKYPDVPLARARTEAAQWREVARTGANPVVTRRVERAKVVESQAATFEVLARQWLAHQATKTDPFTPAHLLDCTQRLEKHVFPTIGKLPLKDIEPVAIANVVKAISARGVEHMAGRCLTMIRQCLDFAIAQGLIYTNAARDTKAILQVPKSTHQPALTTVEDLRALLAKLDEKTSTRRSTLIGARLLALTALRTIELRGGHWSEVDFDAATWSIPAERMKMRKVHVVPLSTQAVTLLRELHVLTGDGDLMFPGAGPRHPIMSEATINSAIKRAGYAGRHCGHGFRATFSTVMNQRPEDRDIIEFCLAHVPKDKVHVAYNRGSYLDHRRVLMQAWADQVYAVQPPKVVDIGTARKAA